MKRYCPQTKERFDLIFIPVSSGSVTINDDSSVQILAEEACGVDEIDAQVNYTITFSL